MDAMAQSKGYGQAHGYNAPLGTDTFIFQDDGLVPNSTLPLIVRRGAIPPSASDPGKAFEATFAKNGWTNANREGIEDYHHYHANAHEVLGIASGSATIRFGGESGETVGVTAGDVVVVPAGVSHAVINSSGDFLVIGAYEGGREPNEMRDDPKAVAAGRKSAAQVPLPGADPVDGADGPLMKLWR
jgi:uncharacterized protein YjlB